MEFFDTLGSLVSQRWKERNYDEAAFPEVATRALSELPPAQHVSMWDVVRWAMTVDDLPRQDDIQARFGDPPLTVYTGRKFRIEVLFWVRGLPAVHQHEFSGAFHVMQGSSIHTIWDFEPQEQIEVRLLLGRTSFNRGEILIKGDSRPILAGNRMFHATYHLARPSISVVIRTLREMNRQPQYCIRLPTIALATLDEISTVIRQKQILNMLLTVDKRAEFDQICRHLLATKDAYSVFEFLFSTYTSIEDEEERESLLLMARLKHPRLVEYLQPALLRGEIGDRLLKLQRTVDNAEVKFFLALLLNVPDRKALLGLIEQRLSGCDPVTTVVGWVQKLSEEDSIGIRFEDSWLLMLECLLKDSSDQEIIQAFAARYGRERVPKLEELRQLCSGLQASWLLRFLGLSNPFEAKTVVTRVDTVPRKITESDAAHKMLATSEAVCGHEAEAPAVRERSVKAAYRCFLDEQPDSLVPRAARKTNGRKTNGLSKHVAWIVNPSLRFSASGQCPDPDVHFAEAVTVPEPTAWVGDPVTSVVNPFVLGPRAAEVVPALQGGGGLTENVPAELLTQMIEAGLIYEPTSFEEKRREWRDSLRSAREKFQDGYAALGRLLHPFTLSAARSHFRQIIQAGKPRYGDKQTARRWNQHNEPVARFLHHQLTPIVEEVAGVPIKPSYVYFASYHQSAQLPRHVDRAQCEFSLSMLIDYSPEPEAESPWPLWLDTKAGSVAVHQRLGDTLIYRGRELPHYRHELPSGHASTHLFFHYVPADFGGALD